MSSDEESSNINGKPAQIGWYSFYTHKIELYNYFHHCFLFLKVEFFWIFHAKYAKTTRVASTMAFTPVMDVLDFSNVQSEGIVNMFVKAKFKANVQLIKPIGTSAGRVDYANVSKLA